LWLVAAVFTVVATAVAAAAVIVVCLLGLHNALCNSKIEIKLQSKKFVNIKNEFSELF